MGFQLGKGDVVFGHPGEAFEADDSCYLLASPNCGEGEFQIVEGAVRVFAQGKLPSVVGDEIVPSVVFVIETMSRTNWDGSTKIISSPTVKSVTIPSSPRLMSPLPETLMVVISIRSAPVIKVSKLPFRPSPLNRKRSLRRTSSPAPPVQGGLVAEINLVCHQRIVAVAAFQPQRAGAVAAHVDKDIVNRKTQKGGGFALAYVAAGGQRVIAFGSDTFNRAAVDVEVFYREPRDA